MNASRFIARRLAADKGGRANTVMVKIATLSVAIGLSVMIFSLGVIFGFKREISEKLTGFLSHVQIRHFDHNTSYETVPISADQPFLDTLPWIPGFGHMNRYAIKAGVLKGEEAIQGVVLKGIGPDYDWTFFRKNLKAGELPVVSDSIRNKDVLISDRLARQMKLNVGDKFEMMFIQNPPRRDRFKVSGIYETDLQTVDNILVLGDIRNVQRLNGWTSDQITGFELATVDFDRLETLGNNVFDALDGMSDRNEGQLMVTNLRESNPVIFDWLDTHNLNAVIIITIMLLVAGFNIIAALLIILLEKTSMIGILKALGMPDSGIRRIFVLRSSRLVLKGMLWGNAVGLGFCYLQQYTGLLKLNSEGYFLSHVPVYIDWGSVGLLNLGIFAAAILFVFIPTSIVSRIRPEKSIRFE